MKAIFNDFQDYSSSLDGAAVHNRDELFAILESAQDRDSFACELEGENGYKLTLGVGKDCGFVQYSRTNGDSPYLVAVAEEAPCYEEEEYVEFLCGDTPSPIPSRNILPMAKVKEIAGHFVETGERSPNVTWEEI